MQGLIDRLVLPRYSDFEDSFRLLLVSFFVREHGLFLFFFIGALILELFVFALLVFTLIFIQLIVFTLLLFKLIVFALIFLILIFFVPSLLLDGRSIGFTATRGFFLGSSCRDCCCFRCCCSF